MQGGISCGDHLTFGGGEIDALLGRKGFEALLETRRADGSRVDDVDLNTVGDSQFRNRFGKGMHGRVDRAANRELGAGSAAARS